MESDDEKQEEKKPQQMSASQILRLLKKKKQLLDLKEKMLKENAELDRNKFNDENRIGF